MGSECQAICDGTSNCAAFEFEFATGECEMVSGVDKELALQDEDGPCNGESCCYGRPLPAPTGYMNVAARCKPDGKTLSECLRLWSAALARNLVMLVRQERARMWMATTRHRRDMESVVLFLCAYKIRNWSNAHTICRCAPVSYGEHMYCLEFVVSFILEFVVFLFCYFSLDTR